MLTFIGGLFAGSIITIVMISLMFAAKRGDEHIN